MKNFPKKFFTEFKEFISKGNALDLAVGMMVGSAFTAIVTSFVNDLFTPLLNLIFNKKAEDGSTISFVDNVSWHGIQFGSFINAIITFILTAFCLFVIIKAINSLRNIGKKKKRKRLPLLQPKSAPSVNQKSTSTQQDALTAHQSFPQKTLKQQQAKKTKRTSIHQNALRNNCVSGAHFYTQIQKSMRPASNHPAMRYQSS